MSRSSPGSFLFFDCALRVLKVLTVEQITSTDSARFVIVKFNPDDATAVRGSKTLERARRLRRGRR